MVQIQPPKIRTAAAKGSCAKHYVNLLPEEAQGQQMGVDAAAERKQALGGWAGARRLGGRSAAGRALGG